MTGVEAIFVVFGGFAGGLVARHYLSRRRADELERKRKLESVARAARRIIGYIPDEQLAGPSVVALADALDELDGIRTSRPLRRPG